MLKEKERWLDLFENDTRAADECVGDVDERQVEVKNNGG